MKNKSISLVSLIAGALLTPAFARVGETEAEIASRYGQSFASDSGVVPGMPIKLYKMADLTIGVVLFKGKSVGEIISKTDESALSISEVEVLLRVNSGGMEWVKKPSPSRTGFWRIESLGRGAQFDGRRLTVFSNELISMTKEGREKSAREKLKGF